LPANLAEITAFYETELSNLGFEVEPAVDETAGQALVNFYKEGTSGVVIIVQIGGGLHGVGITFNT
jgi:hypothetical protein